MKSPRPSLFSAARLVHGSPFAIVITLAAFAGQLHASDASAAPKDHAMFFGGDIAIEYAGSRRLVVGAEKNEVVVRIDGKRVGVQMSKVGPIRVERSLKLAETVAQVDAFSVTAAVARKEVPEQGMLDQMAAMQSLADQSQEDYVAGLHKLDRAGGYEANAGISGSGAADFAKAKAGLENTVQLMRDSDTLMTAAQNNEFSAMTRGDRTSDSLHVSGSVSSPRPSRDAFLLFIVEVRDGPEGKRQNQIHLEPLKQLGPKPHPFDFMLTGLPKGFLMDQSSLHLFADGREIASNLSEKRVDLTADDAMRFMTMSFVADHANDTLVAAPLRIVVPAGLKDQMRPEYLKAPVYLTIAPNGAVAGAAADRAGGALDPEIDAAVRKFWFTPALHEGKPVESVVELRLGDYLR